MTMHSIIVQKRRKRSINFTESDRQILMNLVQPHLSVIENKRMDKFTSKLKSETWENIKSQYNQLNTEPRTALQLKLFYEANKYRMRRMNKSTSDTNDSDEKSDDKIVKIELERRTILDALAQAETEIGEDSGSPKAKIKCVKIEKLQDTLLKTKNSPASPSQAAGKQTQLLSMPPTDVSNASASNFQLRSSNVVRPMPILNANLPSPSLTPTVTSSTDSAATGASNKQEELHAMRMKILEDERLFRRKEHLKHMEYFEIGIMALKAVLLKQAQSMPIIPTPNK